MNFPTTFNLSALLFGMTVLCVSPVVAQSQSQSVDACYAAKDETCLEDIFGDILSDPAPEKTRAIYLLGLLQQDAGDFVAAKKTFMMGVAFGKSIAAQEALTELFHSHPEAFNEPTDCLTMQSSACFEAIIATGEGTAVRNAQYLYGRGLLVSDAPKGAALLEASDAAGHGTSACILQELFRDGAVGVPADYHESVYYGLKCASKNPFPRLNVEHFKKYEAAEGHKAYAFAENGIAYYADGMANPEVAARLAFEYCNASPHRTADSPACRLINIDGIFVDGPEAPDLPEFSGSIDGLIRVEAQHSFQDQYTAQEGLKVFVQSKNGAWTWRSSSEPDADLDILTQEAIEICGTNWRSFLDYPCEVINVNGEWVE